MAFYHLKTQCCVIYSILFRIAFFLEFLASFKSTENHYTEILAYEQCSLFITLCLESIVMDHVISELRYKGTILQRHYRKMTMKWSFSYNTFVKFHGK